MLSLILEEESQVASARRAAVSVASSVGFGDADAGRVAIVATELATNVLKHAGRGEMLVGAFDDGDVAGVECLALDSGPGIADLSAAMRDGFSTAGSAGSGLGAIHRQSQFVDVFARPGQGLALLARLQPSVRQGAAAGVASTFGAVSIAKSGEEACGDGWSVRRESGGLAMLVVDGLGHGPLAAIAAHAAIRAFGGGSGQPSPLLMDRLHTALRGTRGAAAAVVRLPDAGAVEFIGVGNIAGVVVSGDELRRMVSYNGTLGHAFKTVQVFTYPAGDDALVVLASDGLGTSWSLDAYPGLSHRHPTLIAGVLYRDFSRRRDDVTVLVARRGAP